MRRKRRTQFQRHMWILHVLMESGSENRIDLARKAGLSYARSDRILVNLVSHGMITDDSKISVRGISYCISSLGVKTYKLAVEVYENAGMILVK